MIVNFINFVAFKVIFAIKCRNISFTGTMTKIAVAQIGTCLSDTKASLDKLESYAADAASKKVQLVVFPEAYLGGYPKGLDFGATLGIRTEPGRDMFAEYADGAVEIKSAPVERLKQIAKKYSLYMVVGVVERDGGTLYCTALYFSPQGELVGKHRKLMPTALERVIWGFGDGTDLAVIESPLGKIGGLICWENYMPLARMALYQQQVQLYCAPTVDDRDMWIPTVRHIAREGRCFVLSSCQYLTRNNYPAAWLETARNLPDVPIRGGSCIINPMGEILAGPVYDQETLLLADIDINDIIKGKFDFDVAGHYARPDVFKFQIL
jgi:nitrilase